MCNNSLPKLPGFPGGGAKCAKDFRDLSLIPKTRIYPVYGASGREAFLVHRSRRVTNCGALGRENVGLSNRIAGESPAHRKSKVSLAMVFNQGLGGPKVNPKGKADGQQINISALLYLFNKVRNLVGKASNWILVDGITQEVPAGSRVYTANSTEQVP